MNSHILMNEADPEPMPKISLVRRRKNRSYDLPTEASERARLRLEGQAKVGSGATSSFIPNAEDITVEMDHGIPTVEIDLPPNDSQTIEKIATTCLHGEHHSDVHALVTKRKISDKWELKLQFLPEKREL